MLDESLPVSMVLGMLVSSGGPKRPPKDPLSKLHGKGEKAILQMAALEVLQNSYYSRIRRIALVVLPHISTL